MTIGLFLFKIGIKVSATIAEQGGLMGTQLGDPDVGHKSCARHGQACVDAMRYIEDVVTGQPMPLDRAAERAVCEQHIKECPECLAYAEQRSSEHHDLLESLGLLDPPKTGL